MRIVRVVLEQTDYEEWTVRGVATTGEGVQKIIDENNIHPHNLDVQVTTLSD